MIIPVRRFFSGADSTVCKAVPAKFFGVRIKCFLISASSRHSYHIIIPCYRAGNADNHDVFLHFIYPAENNNILLVVIRDKPLEPFPGILYLPERRMLQVIWLSFATYCCSCACFSYPSNSQSSSCFSFHSINCPNSCPMNSNFLPGCAII